jgi:hypothetical protein
MKKRQFPALIVNASLVLSVTGCVSYTAQIQRSEQLGDIRVKLDSVTVKRGGDSRLTFTVSSVPRGVKLLAASVTADSDPLCDSGRAAEKIGRSSGKPVQDALVSGEQISFSFFDEANSAITGESPRLDLLVESPEGVQRCIRIALDVDNAGLDWRSNQRWTLGIEISGEGFTSRFGSVTTIISLPVTLGYWLEDYHLEIGGGIASATCPGSICEPETEDMEVNYTTSYVLFAGVDRPFYEDGHISLGARLRYRVMYLGADTNDGYEGYWAHGPVLVPYFGGGPPLIEGKSTMGGAKEALASIEVPVGIAFSKSGWFTLTVGGSLTFRATAF